MTIYIVLLAVSSIQGSNIVVIIVYYLQFLNCLRANGQIKICILIFIILTMELLLIGEALSFQVPPDCIPLPQITAPIPTIDGRFVADILPRSEHEKPRQNFGNNYVELVTL